MAVSHLCTESLFSTILQSELHYCCCYRFSSSSLRDMKSCLNYFTSLNLYIDSKYSFTFQTKFGDEVRIEDNGQTIGTKTLEDYGPNVNTDDLADDSDLDITSSKILMSMNAMQWKKILKKGYVSGTKWV